MTEEEFRQRDESAVVQYRRTLAGSRALADAWRAYSDELLAYGWIDPRSYGPAQLSPVLYISEAGRVVAFAVYDTLETGGLWLSHVWVSPQRRRAGLFGKLWARLVEMAKADGRETVELCVHPENDRAKFLYNRAGCTTKWLHLELDLTTARGA